MSRIATAARSLWTYGSGQEVASEMASTRASLRDSAFVLHTGWSHARIAKVARSSRRHAARGVAFQAGASKVVAASLVVCAPICFDGVSFHRIRIAQGQGP